MLVNFHSSTSGGLTMFADSARLLLEIVGKQPLARGVITREELPAAITRISDALARTDEQAIEADDGRSPDRPAPVSTRQRLVPILDLLRRTEDLHGYVMWEADADFMSQETEKSSS